MLSALTLLVRCVHAVLAGLTQRTGPPPAELNLAAVTEQVSTLLLPWGSGVGALAGSGRILVQRGASLTEVRHRVALAAPGLAATLENASRQDHRAALAYLQVLDKSLAADLNDLLRRDAGEFRTLLLGIPEVAGDDQMAPYFDELATKARLLDQSQEVLLHLRADLEPGHNN